METRLFWGKVKGQGHEAQKQCQRGSRWSMCLYRLYIASGSAVCTAV